MGGRLIEGGDARRPELAPHLIFARICKQVPEVATAVLPRVGEPGQQLLLQLPGREAYLAMEGGSWVLLAA